MNVHSFIIFEQREANSGQLTHMKPRSFSTKHNTQQTEMNQSQCFIWKADS